MRAEKKTKKPTNKYERAIRSGFNRNTEALGLPNYFASQKVRAKITQDEEQRGNKTILKDTKEAAKKKKEQKGNFRKNARSQPKARSQSRRGRSKKLSDYSMSGSEEGAYCGN